MDLKTEYLGLKLKNPIVAGASPLSNDIGTARALEDAGVAAIVLPSLFQEEIENEAAAQEHFEQATASTSAEATSYTPGLEYQPRGPQEYANHVSKMKEAVGVPVIASLNGTTLGGWTKYAKSLEQAGADALELNIYALETDPNVPASDIENRYVEILQAVKWSVDIPVAMKLAPYFTSMAHFAKRLDSAGADGLVLFNRFYQPDIDIETLEVVPDLALSAPHEMRVPLRWIAILDPLVEADLAATTAVYSTADVLKLLMVGADVVMLVAALLRNGPRAVSEVLLRLEKWMEEHEYTSVNQMQGSMNHRTSGDPAGFERANYIKALHSYK